MLLGVVFAVPSPTPSVTILQPNGGEIISGDYNIEFNTFGFSSITSVSSNEINMADSSKLTCDKIDANTHFCIFFWKTRDNFDNNFTSFSISVHGLDINNVSKNYSDSTDNTFSVDNTPPVIDYNFPDNNSWFNPEKNLFSFDLSDATSGIDKNSILVSVLGKDYNILDSKVKYNSLTGKLDFNPSEIDFNNGQTYLMDVDVNDLAKNSATTKTLSFYVDKNAPIVIDFNSEKTTNKQKPDFNIFAIDQNGLSGLNKMYFSCDQTNWFDKNYADGTISDFNIINPAYGCNSGDGNKTIYFKVSDNAGNYSDIIDTNIYYDSTSPTTTITISDESWVKSWTSDLNWTSDSSVDYNISCSEENTNINLWVYNQGILINSNIINSNFYAGNIILDGNYKIVANCEDVVGNTDSNKQIIFGIDVNSPLTSNISLPIAQNDLNILISWSNAKIFSDVNYFLWGKLSDELDFNLIKGPTNDLNYLDINKTVDKNYCYFVQTINLFGKDTNSNIICVLIDITAPIISDTNLVASVSSNNVTLFFYATDINGSGVKEYYVSKDKNIWDYTTSNSYSFSGLANGNYTFYVIATDYADNNSLDKNISVTINVVKVTSGGSSGGSSGGGGVLPKPLTTSDVNMVISTEEPEIFDFNNNSSIENIDSGEQNERLLGGLIEDTNQSFTAIGAFSLIEMLQSSWLSLGLLLILAIFLIFLFVVKSRKKEGLKGSGRILLENDTDDFSVNYSKPKWAYNEK